MQTSMTIKGEAEECKLASQMDLRLCSGVTVTRQGERPIHEVYKLAQDGESLDAMLTDWYKD